MLKFATYVFALFILCAFTFAGDTGVTITNTTDGFSITMPSGWTDLSKKNLQLSAAFINPGHKEGYPDGLISVFTEGLLPVVKFDDRVAQLMKNNKVDKKGKWNIAPNAASLSYVKEENGQKYNHTLYLADCNSYLLGVEISMLDKRQTEFAPALQDAVKSFKLLTERKFENTKAGYTVKIPKGWRVDNPEDGRMVYITGPYSKDEIDVKVYFNTGDNTLDDHVKEIMVESDKLTGLKEINGAKARQFTGTFDDAGKKTNYTVTIAENYPFFIHINMLSDSAENQKKPATKVFEEFMKNFTVQDAKEYKLPTGFAVKLPSSWKQTVSEDNSIKFDWDFGGSLEAVKLPAGSGFKKTVNVHADGGDYKEFKINGLKAASSVQHMQVVMKGGAQMDDLMKELSAAEYNIGIELASGEILLLKFRIHEDVFVIFDKQAEKILGTIR